ncbi:MAG TPA: O-antigen ligase family protein [Chitinophagaceae bacterium]|nr:O-antigen ligase family protein [Chitinophagaceae bacterium]
MNNAGNIHPFDARTGSLRLSNPFVTGTLLLLLAAVALLAAHSGMIVIAGCLALIIAGAYLYCLFSYPELGLYTAVALSFVLIGLGRYAKDLQVGLGLDGILILTYLALFMKKFREGIDWTPAKKDVTLLALIWFAYALFQIVNPEAQSFAAWFSGRGVSFYMLMVVPLALLFINTTRRLDLFMYACGIFSILATLKGIMQLKMGLDGAEQAWLDEGNYKTHVLFGKLRVFSFMSDAGQFGANQAYSAVVAFIYGMAQTSWKKKLFFRTVALLGLYGMVISGTRGAMIVPMAAFMTFFILRKNVRILSIGVTLLAMVFVFFKFTTIGQGNAQIRRMRTAFDPNDASLQVRLDNQKLLKRYMKSRPFGAGIGHGGVKAQRYLPNAYLSQIATDSWYVLIWVEEGIIGLLLHLFILFYIVIKASRRVMFQVRDPKLKLMISALISGMVGIMLASYGNAILGTMPTGMLIYVSMAIMMNTKTLEESINQQKENKVK